MPRTLKSIIPALVFVCFVVCAPGSAYAALGAKYESPDRSGAAPKAAAVKQAANSNAQAAAPSRGGGQVVATVKLPQKYIKAMMKEHARFTEAYANAEMGLRYYFKTGYDADRGKKPPTEEEIKAMRFVIKLQMQDLESSALRYASNIRLAMIAMLDFTPEEQAMFATALGQIVGTPADALGTTVSSVMSNLRDALTGTAQAADTVKNNIDKVNPSDYKTIGQRMSQAAKDAYNYVASSYAANVVATGLKLVTGTVLSTAGYITGMTMVAGATGPVGIAAGMILAIGSAIGGGLEFVNDMWTFSHAVKGEEVNPKTMEVPSKISKWTSLTTTFISPGNSTAEIITNIISGTKDFWIDWISSAEDPSIPGAKGAQDVKKAKESAGGGGGGGGGKGSGSGGCGCD